ncbi:MAG: GtrA family protein [Sphingomonas sp.]
MTGTISARAPRSRRVAVRWPRWLLRHRDIFSRHGTALFLKNALVSTIAFGLDRLLLWLAVSSLHVAKMLAVGVAFLIANAFHYVVARLWVFNETHRGVVVGYLYFVANAAVGWLVIMGLFWVLTDKLGVYYLIARVITSLCAGTLVFLLNATLNFKVL